MTTIPGIQQIAQINKQKKQKQKQKRIQIVMSNHQHTSPNIFFLDNNKSSINSNSFSYITSDYNSQYILTPGFPITDIHALSI